MTQCLIRSLALLLASASFSAVADESINPYTGTYANDPGHTRFLWRIQHLGLSNYTARVNDVSIELSYDADDVSNSKVMVTIDPTSVDTGFVGDVDFDEEIYASENILNSSVFPTIDFVSSSVEQQPDGALLVAGDLSLLGVKQPATLLVKLTGETEEHYFAKVPALGFHASGSIDRTEFGLDFLAGSALGDVIEIDVTAEFIKQ